MNLTTFQRTGNSVEKSSVAQSPSAKKRVLTSASRQGVGKFYLPVSTTQYKPFLNVLVVTTKLFRDGSLKIHHGNTNKFLEGLGGSSLFHQHVVVQEKFPIPTILPTHKPNLVTLL